LRSSEIRRSTRAVGLPFIVLKVPREDKPTLSIDVNVPGSVVARPRHEHVIAPPHLPHAYTLPRTVTVVKSRAGPNVNRSVKSLPT